MKTIILIAVAGAAAQLLDGSLGMGYGLTATSLLLVLGTNPAAASAAVHLAEIGANAASGLSHWRFGNVDWPVVLKIGVPGAVGAFLGASVLSSLSTEMAAPVVSGLLLCVGIYVLIRFASGRAPAPASRGPLPRKMLWPLGLGAGFVDASGGGGWGPIATPTMLATGRMTPRKTIGSVDTSELMVSLAASVGFLVYLPSGSIQFDWVIGLLVGGVVAAPAAAWFVKSVPAEVLGVAAGGLIVITNTNSLIEAIHFTGAPALLVRAFVVGAALLILGSVLLRRLRERRAAASV